jgi:hypothetical protein
VTHILSLGAGVNSSAVLVLASQKRVQVDEAVFADTGGEHPETYGYIEQVLQPLCDRSAIPLVIVRAQRPPLYDSFFAHQAIPSRYYRFCTREWKIYPIRKYLKARYGDEYTVILGIAADERHRMQPEKARDHAEYIYPLIDLNIDREGCIQLIADAKLPVPRKSGCFFCPFQRKSEWLKLLADNRDLFLRAEALEKNGRKYPEMLLWSKPLEKLRDAIENQRNLDAWLEPEPGLGSCMFCEVGQEACR